MNSLFTALKNRIKAVIKSNDAQEITGDVLQSTLTDMVDTTDSVLEANGADSLAKRASEYGHNFREMQTVDTTTGAGITADSPIQIEMGSDEWDGGVKHTHWVINLTAYGDTETVYVRINLKLNDSIYPRTDWNAWETNLIVRSSLTTKKLNVRVGTETYSKTVDLVPNAENYIGVVVKSGGDIFLNNRTFQKQSSISVDAALSDTSTNPVQNKVVTAALGKKANTESPAFTGTPTAPTQPKSERNTRIATTGFAYNVAEEYGFRASEYGQNYRSIGAMGGNGTKGSPFTAVIGSDEWDGGLAAYNIYSGELAALDTDDNPLGEAFLKLDAMSWDAVYPEDDWNARTIACIIKNTAPAYSTLQIQVGNYDNLKTVIPLAEGMNYIEVLLEGHEEGTKLTARNTSLGEAPQFMGEAVPADEEPDEEDYFAWGTIPPKGRNCSFLAKTPGYYYHFGQTTLSEGETAIFYTVDFGSSWKKITLPASGGTGGGETDTFDGNKTITGNLNVGGALAVTGSVTAQSMALGSTPVSDSDNMSVPTTSWANNRICTNAYKKALYVQSTNKTLTVTELLSASYIILSGYMAGNICTLTFPTTIYKKGYVFDIDIFVLAGINKIVVKRSDTGAEVASVIRGSNNVINANVKIGATSATANNVQVEVFAVGGADIVFPSASTASLVAGDDASVMEEPSQDEQI